MRRASLLGSYNKKKEGGGFFWKAYSNRRSIRENNVSSKRWVPRGEKKEKVFLVEENLLP